MNDAQSDNGSSQAKHENPKEADRFFDAVESEVRDALYEIALRESAKSYLEATRAEQARAQREAAAHSLKLAINFLWDRGVESQSLLPLRSLEGALSDLDNGQVGTLLTPEKSNGRSQKSIALSIYHAAAAAAATCLMNDGKDRETACREVHKKLPKLFEGHRQLMNFRSSLLSHKARAEAVDFYERMVGQYRGVEGAADTLINLLIRHGYGKNPPA